MKKILKAAGKLVGYLLSAVLIVLIGFVVFLSITEFRPEDREAAEVSGWRKEAFTGESVSVLSWNIGYAGLDADADFFMDGGTRVRPTDEYYINVNMDNMACRIRELDADFTLLQEVDRNSARSYGLDELRRMEDLTGLSTAFAYNYRCPFVPIPFPPLGRIESGIASLSEYKMAEAERVSLPCPFSWPVSAANIKRCLLITRTPIEGSEKELVMVNLHLEAYDSGEGKIAQTKMLMDILEEEYAKGNYVIAGGDFNQAFPGSLDRYPVEKPEIWSPMYLEENALPDGWRYAYDVETPTCRLLNERYNEETTQHYVIDGFIVSPNVEVVSVTTVDEAFFNSDHNPVLLEVKLIP